mmetsp:Transcript_3579/g.7452  ORF Transcript_3579/g.7452 Transcript_3579/m.7452 type:complete len:86 (+) Transcript_3579:1394-1651(+)
MSILAMTAVWKTAARHSFLTWRKLMNVSIAATDMRKRMYVTNNDYSYREDTEEIKGDLFTDFYSVNRCSVHCFGLRVKCVFFVVK